MSGQKHLRPGEKRRLRKEHREAVIRAGYAARVPLVEIAAALGSTPASVRVTACKMGVTNQGRAKYDYRRGFAVPPHLRADYLALIRAGFPARQIKEMLNLEDLRREVTA